MMSRLPVLRIALVFPLMLFNSMTVSTVYTFLPKLVKEFGTSEVNAGYDVGLIASSLFASRTFFYIFWGYVSDRIGRKIPLAIASYGLAFSTLTFGFSANFYYALGTRFIQGCFMVLNILCKSILADVCDEKDFTYSLSILVSANSLGRVLGPSLGGLLSFPVQQFPRVFPGGGFFEKNPIFLPMLILSSGLMVANSLMIKYLPSDYRKQTIIYNQVDSQESTDTEEIAPTTSVPKDKLSELEPNGSANVSHVFKSPYEECPDSTPISFCSRIGESKIVRVLKTKECLVSCFLNFFYSIVSVGTSETFPLFASTTRKLNGFGFSPAKIGLALLIASIFLILFQSLLQARISNFFGPKRLLIFSMLEYAVLYPLLPSLVIIGNEYAQLIVLCVWLFVIRAHTAIGNLGVNVFIRNSVRSDLIGSAMGLAQAANSAGSMFSPSVFGMIYAWSLKNVKNGVMGFPFNQYFVFLIQSLWAVFIVVLTCFVPKTMEKRKIEK